MSTRKSSRPTSCKCRVTRTGRTSSSVFEILNDDVSKLTVEDTHKLHLITDLAEKRFDFNAIDSLLD